METPRFDERQNLHWQYLIGLGSLMMLALIISLTTPDASAYNSFMLSVTTFVGLVAAVGFTSMHTVVTRETLTFGFPLWRTRLRVDEIEVVGIEGMRFWYGVGVNFTGELWVYTVHMGEGVRIKHRGRSYLIGSGDAEQLRHALLQLARERIERLTEEPAVL